MHSGIYFAQMSRNLTSIFHFFFIQNTLCKETCFYGIKHFCPKFSVNGVSSVDRDVMEDADGILGREWSRIKLDLDDLINLQRE